MVWRAGFSWGCSMAMKERCFPHGVSAEPISLHTAGESRFNEVSQKLSFDLEKQLTEKFQPALKRKWTLLVLPSTPSVLPENPQWKQQAFVTICIYCMSLSREPWLASSGPILELWTLLWPHDQIKHKQGHASSWSCSSRTARPGWLLENHRRAQVEGTLKGRLVQRFMGKGA